jgi:hypothetical protein
MYKATVRRMIRHTIKSLNEGDYGPALRMFAKDATLAFPGDNSWANQFRPTALGREAFATHRGRAELEAFLQRYVAHGLQMEVEDILVNGPPWNMRARRECTTGSRCRWPRHLRESRGAVRQRPVGKDPRSGGLRRHHARRRVRQGIRLDDNRVAGCHLTGLEHPGVCPAPTRMERVAHAMEVTVEEPLCVLRAGVSEHGDLEKDIADTHPDTWPDRGPVDARDRDVARCARMDRMASARSESMTSDDQMHTA